MNEDPLDPTLLAEKINQSDAKLHQLEHDAEYLNQAALSSVTLAVPAGTHVVELFRQGADRSAEKNEKEDSAC